MFKAPEDDACGWRRNPHLFTQQTTPLSARIAAEKPHLADELRRLRALLGNEKFTAYIEPLHNINKSGQTLLITTGSEMRRTHIERECLSELKEAFGARFVRVIAMR